MMATNGNFGSWNSSGLPGTTIVRGWREGDTMVMGVVHWNEAGEGGGGGGVQLAMSLPRPSLGSMILFLVVFRSHQILALENVHFISCFVTSLVIQKAEEMEPFSFVEGTAMLHKSLIRLAGRSQLSER